MSVRFWIVTPSYNSLKWLPCAVASVADQAGKDLVVHHHVQDGGSSDGTREWLEQYAAECVRNPKEAYSFSYESAPDHGMYDAINKGWANAPECYDYIAHLNSDEQYTVDALKTVAEMAKTRSEVDIVLGDAIVVDLQGRYICHQSNVNPWGWMSRFFCLILTCTAFYRQEFMRRSGCRFDPSWRMMGDVLFYRQLFKSPVRSVLCNQITSVFMETGENLGTTPANRNELLRYREKYRGRLGCFSPWVRKFNTARRILKDLVNRSPKQYQIFRSDVKMGRITFEIARQRTLWKRKV